MFERIQVCLDGSKAAEQILPYVKATASCFSSRIILFQAIPEPVSVTPAIPVAPPLDIQTEGELKEVELVEQESRDYLSEVAKRVKGKGIRVEKVMVEGEPGDSIVNYAENNNIDLIALATCGKGGFRQMVFGSVADFVLRQTGLPILLIKPGEQESPASMKPNPFEKILVCLDGSKLAEQILPYAKSQAIKFGSKLILLQVATIPTLALTGAGSVTPATSGELIAEEISISEEQSQKYLDSVAKSITPEHSDVETVVLQTSPVGSAIVSYADDNGIGLVCLATHGHGSLGKLVFGSVADHVLRNSGLPTLLIKPKEMEE